MSLQRPGYFVIVIGFAISISLGRLSTAEEQEDRVRLHAKIDLTESRTSLRFSSNEKYLIIGTDRLSRFGRGTVHLFELATKKFGFSKSYKRGVISADLSPNGKLLAVTAGAEVIDVSTGEVRARLPDCADVRFIDNDTLFVQSRMLMELSFRDGAVRNPDIADGNIYRFAVSPNGMIATVRDDSPPRSEKAVHSSSWRIAIHKPGDHSIGSTKEDMHGFAPSLFWNIDGTVLLVGGSPNDRTARLWNVTTNVDQTLPWLNVDAAQFLGDDRILAVVQRPDRGGMCLVLHSLTNGSKSQVLKAFDLPKLAAISPTGSYIAVSSPEGVQVFKYNDEMAASD